MTTKHTPGPWAFQKVGKEYCLTGQHCMRPIVLANRKGNLTSLVNGFLVPLDPTHPDAKLISAAPDMYEALKAVGDYFNSPMDISKDDVLSIIEQAIEKATL